MSRIYFSFLLVGIVFSNSLQAQTYSVDVPEPFPSPDYMVVKTLGGDILGLNSVFWGDLERAGYDVVNSIYANAMLRPPKISTPIDGKEVIVDIFRILQNLHSVDPSFLPMKRSAMLSHMKVFGINRQEAKAGIAEGLEMGVLTLLPRKPGILGKITMSGPSITLTPNAVAPNAPVEEEEPLWEPPTVYVFDFNYTYRSSIRCGHTAIELSASVRNSETQKVLATMRFTQPKLAGRCPREIAAELIQRMRKAAQYDLDVNLGASTSDVKAIATVSDGGGGCKGKRPSAWSKRIASELISLYTVVDRDEFEHLLDEQKNAIYIVMYIYAWII